MKVKCDRTMEMLLALLRAAINETPTDKKWFEHATEEEWRACRRMAVNQGVMALAWDGVRRLPEELWPPKAMKVKWSMAVEDYGRRYAYYCRAVYELQKFYAEHGIVMMQMKGVGFSSYYPIPELREGGDIDIATWSADTSVMSDEEANGMADRLMEEQGIAVDYSHPKHSHFKFHRVLVENHKRFLDVKGIGMAEQMEVVLKKYRNPVKTVLLGGRFEVNTPGVSFNEVFMSFHALQHFGWGMGLHILCDWACLLNRFGLVLPEGTENRIYREFVCALTEVCNRWLGTEVKVEAKENKVKMVMKEVCRGRRDRKCRTKKTLGIVWFKAKELYLLEHDRSRMLGESFWKKVAKAAIRHLKHPKGILRT